MEGDQLLLIYEYMENNSLARALFGKLFFHVVKFCSSFINIIYNVLCLSVGARTHTHTPHMILLSNFLFYDV